LWKDKARLMQTIYKHVKGNAMNAQFVTALHKSTLGRIDMLAERDSYSCSKAVLAEAVAVPEFLRRLGPLNHSKGLGRVARLPRELAKEAVTAAKASGTPEKALIEALIEAGCRIIERHGGVAKTAAIISQPRRVAYDWSDFVRLEPPKGQRTSGRFKSETRHLGRIAGF
jgi:hypothetical protein